MLTKTTDESANSLDARLNKIERLKELGIDPYPALAFRPTYSIECITTNSPHFIHTKKIVRLAGRVAAKRTMGKAIFIDVMEGSRKLQTYITKAARGSIWALAELIDVGDFIGVEGTVFVTRRGETTVDVASLQILGVPTRQLPLGKRSAEGEVYSGLNDKGQLLRDRHIDLLVNPALRERIVMRSQMLREIRAYLFEEGFVELETPVLGREYGGAAARPFTSYCNALKAQMYLRVSPECNLKRALCGGLDRVFEIGKNFRNEGIDASHNPEFTMLEWYEAYSDYEHQMERFESLVSRLATRISGSQKICFKGHEVDFSPPWQRLRIIDGVAAHLQLSEDELTAEALAVALPDNGKLDHMSWGELLMAVFEEHVEPELVGPVFVIDHPVEISPLTKLHRNDSRFVERFEPFVLGIEIGNAYSELNDPVEQRRRLEEQDLVRDDPYGLDEAFMTAIEHGMPQAGGTGMGIDRIAMILTDAERLSDVILFPCV